MASLGTETAFEVLARAKALEAQGRSIINLGIGQPDFATPPHIVEAGRKALADGHHGYTPANGILPLREAVAMDLHRRHRVTVSPDNVLVVPGGKVTMFFAILMFGEAGAEIMYPNPGFPIYESVIRFSGATPVPMPLHESKGFSFSAEEVLAQLTPRTRLIILNSPANPTGGVVPRAEIERLVAGLERFPDVAIMSDEIYSCMVYDGAEHVSLLSYPSIRDRLILLDGWSKTYAMTGWRLGYSVWPDKLIADATRLAINCHSCVNASAQFAGLAALTGPQDAVQHGRGLRRAAQDDRRRAQRAAGLPLRQSRRRLLRLSQHRGHRLRRQGAAGAPPRRGRGGDHRGHQLRRLRRGLSALLLCELAAAAGGGCRAHPPVPRQRAARRAKIIK